MKIGFGLRHCLADLLEGKVDLSEVAYIFRGGTGKFPYGTTLPTEKADLLRYVEAMADSGFCNKDEGLRLASQLWDQGKILYSNALLPVNLYEKHWYDVDEEIPCKFHYRDY